MEKILINEKPAGFLFGYTSYKRFMTAVQLNKSLFIDANGNMTDDAYIEILFCAYGAWCLDNRVQAELSREDISRWADSQVSTEEGSKLVSGLFNEWRESTDVKALIELEQKKSQGLSAPTLTPSSGASLENSGINHGTSTGSRGETQLSQSTD